MKFFYLEEIDRETIEWLYEVIWDNPDDEITILIDCSWWSVALMSPIIDVLNQYKDRITLKSIFMASAGFHIFHSFEWNKLILPECQWVVHHQATELHIFWKDRKIRNMDALVQWRYERSSICNNWNYDFLTKDEKDRMDDGKDIYLDYDRLVQIYH